MGPYYRGTSQSMGAFFELFYQYPIVMGLLMLSIGGIGLFVWYKKNQSNN